MTDMYKVFLGYKKGTHTRRGQGFSNLEGHRSVCSIVGDAKFDHKVTAAQILTVKVSLSFYKPVGEQEDG